MADIHPFFLQNGELERLQDKADAVVAYNDGDSRGQYAFDFQRIRSTSDMVAGAAYAIIAGGNNNRIDSGSSNAVILGGFSNDVSSTSTFSTLVGGWTQTIDDSDYGFIGGGLRNDILSSSDRSAVCGGDGNTITDTSQYANIGGGRDNLINNQVAGDAATYATISGGWLNEVDGALGGIICGGRQNSVQDTSSYSVVCGGQSNSIATSLHGSVGGGLSNSITGADYACITGGRSSVVSADYASVLGGEDNLASGSYSVALGNDAAATRRGELAQSAGQFAAQGDAQSMVLIARNTTTSATVTTLFLDGSSAALTIPDDTAWFVDAHIAALRNDGTQGAGYRRSASFRKDGAAAAVQIGTTNATATHEDVGPWNATLDINSNNIRVRVTGAAGVTIRWVARLTVTQVKI